jgi:arylsulfatase A-like enzyme
MADHRRRGQPFFLFLNLYDVHAPYSPSPASPLRSFGSLSGCIENLALPFVLPRVSGHAYLRPGFHLSAWSRQMLLGRYHRAIELMDAKLADFYAAARGAHLLDDTLLIVTSDHGEAFGDHELYFHDASVYDTHLHVPLWIHHPDVPAAVVDEVVSTRDLFGLIGAVGLGQDLRGTLLHPAHRRAHPIALAEHFHYPHTDGLLARYTQNLAAAVVGRHKIIVRREGTEYYDLGSDPGETAPAGGTRADFEGACRRDGLPAAAIAAAIAHVRRASAAPTRAPVCDPSSTHTGGRSPTTMPTAGRSRPSASIRSASGA